eukprot:5290153-Prymnesium_polylepis.1
MSAQSCGEGGAPDGVTPARPEGPELGVSSRLAREVRHQPRREDVVRLPSGLQNQLALLLDALAVARRHGPRLREEVGRNSRDQRAAARARSRWSAQC